MSKNRMKNDPDRNYDSNVYGCDVCDVNVLPTEGVRPATMVNQNIKWTGSAPRDGHAPGLRCA